MKNKILVIVEVPLLEQAYEIIIPINKKLSSVINLLEKSINELSDGDLPINHKHNLFNKETGEQYDLNFTVKESEMKNGSKVLLL